jgi:hypothetical protein
LSRIRQGAHFRAIANADDLAFLDSLKPPNELLAFMHGYDENGVWNYNRAKTRLDTLIRPQAQVENQIERGNNTRQRTTNTNSDGQQRRPIRRQRHR